MRDRLDIARVLINRHNSGIIYFYARRYETGP